MFTADHWDGIHRRKGDGVPWFQPTLDQSLSIIDGLGLLSGATAIDVGAGSSTLVGDLIDRGFSEVTAVDLSAAALDTARERLGARATRARFVTGDITEVELPRHAYDLWHDRAAFHFLTETSARAAYVRQVMHALRPGGYVVVATFGPNGPEKCSGLPVVRYDAGELHHAFGADVFARRGEARELHRTPGGIEQEFVYCCCRRGSD